MSRSPLLRLLARAKGWMRLVLVHVLYYTGVLHALKRRRLRGRAVILMYHRVLTAKERSESFSSDGIQVSPESFDRQLGFLKHHFKVASPEQFVAQLQRGETFADATCLITFDDGWRDNLTNALPLLRKHAVPAVIFLPTDFIGTERCFWQESLARQLHRLQRAYRDGSSAASAVVVRHSLASVFVGEGAELKQRIHDYVRALKVLSDQEIDALMNAVVATVGPSQEDHPDRFLSWNEVSTMARAGVTFGSHAVSHRILTRLPKDEVIRELETSKREIAAHAGLDVQLLAYPNGDCNEETAEAARQTNYTAAFTTAHGVVAANDDRFLLRRINIHDRATRTTAGFYATLLGVI